VLKQKYNTLLWELLSPSGGKSSYLFGTIHLPDQSLFRRIPKVKLYIELCDAFMAEYKLDENPQVVQQAFYLDSENSIDKCLGERKFQRVRKQFLKSFDFDIGQYRYIKPMVLENMMVAKFLDQPAAQAMDVLLYEHAREKGKILLGAESLQSQLDIMQIFPLKQQLQNLVKLSRNPARYSRMIRKVKGYYQMENIVGLYKISHASLGSMKKNLVFDRNVRIANSISEQSNECPLFCAVGAAYLYGETGILQLMKQRGYTLRPLHLKL